MKRLIILAILIHSGYWAVCQDSSYTIERKIPVSIIVGSEDTIKTMGRSVLGYESKADRLLKLTDTTYLNKMVGIYLKYNTGPEITVKRNGTTLLIAIPGYTESELIPLTSSAFRLKNAPETIMFLYFDHLNNVPAINVQNPRENFSAGRKGYRL
ncbi:hypothetical protein GCM10027341_16110 [Spirosoma knui]